MSWQIIPGAAAAACLIALASQAGAQDKPAPAKAAAQPAASPAPAKETKPFVRYLALDAPAGTSGAVVVQDAPLVYTRQLLPLDRDGKLAGAGSIDRQIEQVLANLEAVLVAAGSAPGKLVRVNIYADSQKTAGLVREQLSKRLGDAVRPATTTVLTPLAHRQARVAVDAVAIGSPKGSAVALERCGGVADAGCADAAVMPAGGVAYLSGVPEKGELAAATAKSMSTLLATLGHLKLTPAEVVQLKVFIKPAVSAEQALVEIKRLFPGQRIPPVVFVEWLASAPIEIELVAGLPGNGAEGVEFYNPPGVEPSPSFSRVALVRGARQVFISGLSAREAGSGEAQARDVLAQLKAIVDQTGGDMLHLAKATYYVSDDDASKGLDKVRPEFLDAKRPPAASKVTMHAVGQSRRSVTVDMIAVGGKQ